MGNLNPDPTMSDPKHYQVLLRQVALEGEYHSVIQELSAQQEFTLGRDPTTCQMVLDSERYGGVSRRHAVIHPLPPHPNAPHRTLWQICDLESANGTFVNGELLQGCQVLREGDRITLSPNGPEFVLEYRPLLDIKGALSNQPVPQSAETDLTFSQLLPIVSSRSDLAQKAYLLPGIITVIVVILMLATGEQPGVFRILLGMYLGSAAYYFIYQLCGKRKPWWVLLGCTLISSLLLLSPVLPLFIFIFRQVLPGNTSQATGFLPEFMSYLFGAGLMEELLKVLPVLALYFLARRLKSPWREQIGVWEPLDGILLAAASALGFTWMETLLQYVPGITLQVTGLSGEPAGQLAGLQLLIPRILGSVSGHMAYSGYFGYFIGLSVLKPTKRWRILAVGWLTSAVIHALWNASAGTFGVLGLAFVGVLSYAFLTAAILKARELSPTRSQNFATRISLPRDGTL
jgi:RsiW-degrading membrane proteinase PrsW (M82 family)